jgi:hypothetical protein
LVTVPTLFKLALAQRLWFDGDLEGFAVPVHQFTYRGKYMISQAFSSAAQSRYPTAAGHIQ